MPLIDRFARLISADLNAVLDRVEEPQVLLQQSIREMARTGRDPEDVMRDALKRRIAAAKS